MDQPKLERMLRLMKMLTANVEYTVDEIGDRLGMSRRTIYRYIDTFREAGFVIKKSGRCIRFDRESPHFKDISQLVHFTEEEAVILRRAIESIDGTNTLFLNLKHKLYSVYDSKTLADTIVKGRNAGNIHALIEAMEGERQVVLHDYSSAHSIRNRHVEPFAFTTNYVSVWCYDTEDGNNKIFKTARIGSVEVLDDSWQHKAKHEKGFIDIFRMIGNERTRTQLLLGKLAHNLILEEYPLSEQYLIPCENEHWILDTDVANFHGIGRFVAGLLDDIRVLSPEALRTYLKDYLDNNRKNLL